MLIELACEHSGGTNGANRAAWPIKAKRQSVAVIGRNLAIAETNAIPIEDRVLPERDRCSPQRQRGGELVAGMKDQREISGSSCPVGCQIHGSHRSHFGEALERDKQVLHNGHSLEATGSLRIGGLDCAPKRARRCQYGRGMSQNIGQRLIAFATARIDQQEVQCDSPWAHGGDTLDQTCEGGAREGIRSGLARRLVVNGDDGDQVGCGSFPLD